MIPAGVGNADLQIKMMLNLGVTGYVGTPSWLMTLICRVKVDRTEFVATDALGEDARTILDERTWG